MSASPHAIGGNNMAVRRAPLSNLPNAPNSPFRPTAGIKRSRSPRAGSEIPYGQPPPAKKCIVEVEQPRTPSKRRSTQLEGRQGLRGLDNGDFSRNGQKPQEIKDKLINRVTTKQVKEEVSLENLQQWIRHYKRAFPEYVFYFESIPEEQQRIFSKAIISLGSVSFSFIR